MTQPPQREPTWAEAMSLPLACLGAIAGAALGGGLTYLAARAGYYAILLVGVATGFGATFAARRGGWTVSSIAVIVALIAGLYTEWLLFPFTYDNSLGYFIQHIGNLTPFSLLFHTLGAAAAGYIAFADNRRRNSP